MLFVQSKDPLPMFEFVVDRRASFYKFQQKEHQSLR